jgi:hypothetical protein
MSRTAYSSASIHQSKTEFTFKVVWSRVILAGMDRGGLHERIILPEMDDIVALRKQLEYT